VKYQLSFIQSIHKWENNISPPISVLSVNFISETAKRISFKSRVPALRLRSGFNLYSCWSHENQIELYTFLTKGFSCKPRREILIQLKTKTYVLCLCGVFLMKYKESKAMHFYQLVQST
jgi:hypothetical protein